MSYTWCMFVAFLSCSPGRRELFYFIKPLAREDFLKKVDGILAGRNHKERLAACSRTGRRRAPKTRQSVCLLLDRAYPLNTVRHAWYAETLPHAPLSLASGECFSLKSGGLGHVATTASRDFVFNHDGHHHTDLRLQQPYLPSRRLLFARVCGTCYSTSSWWRMGRSGYI